MVEEEVLPSSYKNGRFTNSLYYFLRNNASEAANMLKRGLVGYRYQVKGKRQPADGQFPIDKTWERFLGYPDNPIPRDPQGLGLFGQVLDSRFDESVGMYQALNTGSVRGNPYRLNALHVFGVGYILRPFAGFMVTRRLRIKLLIDAILSTMLPKFEISEPTTDTEAKNKDYYQVNNIPGTSTPNHEDPYPQPFYIKQNNGVPLKNASGTHEYYYFFESPQTTKFVKCNTVYPPINPEDVDPAYKKKFYVKNDSGNFEEMVVHDIGYYAGKDIYVGTAGGTKKNIGAADEYTVFINYSRPTAETPVYRKMTASDNPLARNLYVDRENEVIELVRKYLDVLLTRYRTILIVSGRPVPKYTAISSSSLYTVEDLILRTNNLAACCGLEGIEYDENETDRFLYDVRMIKLKINDIIDFIVSEAFWRYLFDKDKELYWEGKRNPFYDLYGLATLTDDLWEKIRMNAKAWEDFIRSAHMGHEQQQPEKFEGQFNGYAYNDLGTRYDPKNRDKYNEAWNKLDLYYYSEQGFDAQYETRCRTLGATPDIPVIKLDGEAVDLTYVIDLLRIADVWANCDYRGSMYVLATATDVFDGNSLDGRTWLEGLAEIVPSGNEIADQVRLLRQMTVELFEVTQIAALYISDLMVRVVEYGFHYAPGHK